ncbi:hypothetical protein OAG71_00670 [bacterium]|nr:hypothetical protein [bacterium]
MNFSLRSLMLLIAVVAIALGWLGHSLSTMNVYFGSNGNDISFRDTETALIAASQHLEWQHESLTIIVDGIDISNAQLEKNVSRFNIEIRGKIRRSIPDLRPIWPFTKNELAEMIESELETNLGSDSNPKFVFTTFPVGD